MMEYGNGQTNQLVWREMENRYHSEGFEVTLDNMNVNVAMASQYVCPNSKVLDIGCGEGKFGKIIKEKKCQVYGIDLDSTAAKYACENNGYRNVFVFNIENTNAIPDEFKQFESEEKKFDTIALLDVLEHVINPTEVIYNAIRVLKNAGQILISVPNVNNGDIFLNLLRDRFNYREAGVLDNTHTKYFTKTSFIQWIKEINDLNNWSLDCKFIGSTFAYTDYMEEIKKEKEALYQFIQLNPYFHVMQHMFVLTYYEEKTETKDLNQLLSIEPKDLTDDLNLLLQNSLEKELLQEVQLLPNERKIMEQRIYSAETGWEKCKNALESSNNFAEKLAADIESLKTMLNICEAEKEQIVCQWKECAQALENAKKGWKECAEALEINKKGWKECEEALNELKKKHNLK